MIGVELPTQLTDSIFNALVGFLVIAPIFVAGSVAFLGKVVYDDTERPRNRLLTRMFFSGISILISSVFFGILGGTYLYHTFMKHEISSADWGAVMFVIALLIMEAQPGLNFLALRALNGNVELVKQIPEHNDEEGAA